MIKYFIWNENEEIENKKIRNLKKSSYSRRRKL